MTERNYDRCKKCLCWGWTDTHRCPPIWEARIHEERWDNDDWHEVYATSAEDAAAQFAQRFDQGGDYTIINAGCAEIDVRKQGSDEIVLVDVQAESVPRYSGEVRA